MNLKNNYLDASDSEHMLVCKKFDGETPFTTYFYFDEDHKDDLSKSVKSGDVVALEESGNLLGFFLSGHDELIAALNRLSTRKGLGNIFKIRQITKEEADKLPWECSETVVDEAAGGIVAYLNNDHSGRIVSLLNIESLFGNVSKYAK